MAKGHTARALFRFGVVSQVKALVLHREELGWAMREVASMPHIDATGKIHSVAISTLYRWYSDFEQGGIAALEDSVREKTAISEVLSDNFINFLKNEKSVDAEASVPELINRARELNILGRSERVSRVQSLGPANE